MNQWRFCCITVHVISNICVYLLSQVKMAAVKKP